MRTFPIDADRVRLISTGTCAPVTKWIELSDGSRRPDPTGRQDEDEHGRKLWRVEVITPADEDDERDKTTVVEVLIASKDKPDAGSFGDLLTFADLTMSPGYVNKKTGQLSAPRWSASGIRRQGKPQQQPQAA
jgi:hypothetical protein